MLKHTACIVQDWVSGCKEKKGVLLSMEWRQAIQKKRQQWVGLLAKARKMGYDRTELTLTNLMTQLGEFETEYDARRQESPPDAALFADLAEHTRRRWPELWATMSNSLVTGSPEAWVENPFVVVVIVTEASMDTPQERVNFDSRMNQLDAMPLSHDTATLIEQVVDESWGLLKQHVEDAQHQMKEWEYAACMHRLGTYFLSFYSRMQAEAITAIKAAEQAGQLTTIVTDSDDA